MNRPNRADKTLNLWYHWLVYLWTFRLRELFIVEDDFGSLSKGDVRNPCSRRVNMVQSAGGHFLTLFLIICLLCPCNSERAGSILLGPLQATVPKSMGGRIECVVGLWICSIYDIALAYFLLHHFSFPASFEFLAYNDVAAQGYMFVLSGHSSTLS
jgi:hypothetical protein